MIKVVIDPGHGGKDRANRGPTGYIEADGVLTISKYLRQELLNTGAFDVKLTREADATLSLTQRCMAAANFKADLFISEHTNATGKEPNTTVRGTDVFYSVDITTDKTLAESLAAAVSSALGIHNGGAHTRESIKYPGEDYYGVIDTAQDHGVPHVFIIESAFHDNALDEALLKQDANLKKIAKAQAKVICDFFKVSISRNYIEGMTQVVEINPMALRAEIVNGKRPARTNWVNANFFGKSTIGWLISEGKILSRRDEYKTWKGNPKGTLIAYKDGTVFAGLKLDSEIVKELDRIWFCCQGFNLFPLDIKKEGFTDSSIGRACNRVSIGFNKAKGKVMLAVRPSSDAARAVKTLKNLGCDSGICLDSGDSCNLVLGSKALFQTNRALNNIIYW